MISTATSGNGAIQSVSSREVWEETRKFLANHGLDWTGRPRGQRDKDQVAFERRMVPTPTGGVNGRHR